MIDDTRRLRLSIAQVELPDGVHFEQYVLRMPKAALTVLLDDARERVLMIRGTGPYRTAGPGSCPVDTSIPTRILRSRRREVEEETSLRVPAGGGRCWTSGYRLGSEGS